MPRVTVMKISTKMGDRYEKGLIHVGSMARADGIDLHDFRNRKASAELPGILGQGYRVGWYKSRRL